MLVAQWGVRCASRSRRRRHAGASLRRPDSSRNESERTDAASSAPTRSSRVWYKTRPGAGGAALAERARGQITPIVRVRRGTPWSRTTPPCGFLTAASARAAAFCYAAARWTAATRACPVRRSGVGASGACKPIGAAGPSGGAPPPPGDRRRGAPLMWHSGYTCSVRDTKERRVSLPRQDMVLVISKAREQAKELPTQVERPGPSPEQRGGHRVPRPRHAAAASGESGSTITSCSPFGRSCDTPRGQHPSPAALLPF